MQCNESNIAYAMHTILYLVILYNVNVIYHCPVRHTLCLIRMRENTFIYTQHVRYEHINGLWAKIAFALSHFHVKFHGIFAIVVGGRFRFSFDSQFLSARLFLSRLMHVFFFADLVVS